MSYSKDEQKMHIKELQRYLREIAFADPYIPLIIPDGIYGKDTANAVSAFQQKYGLPVTGEVDGNTWNELYRRFLEAVEHLDAPVAVDVFPYNEHIIAVGSAGTPVTILQLMLSGLAVLYSNLPKPAVSGTFDNDTAKGIEMLQRIWGLSPTGKADLITWNRIAEAFNLHMPLIIANELIMPL